MTNKTNPFIAVVLLAMAGCSQGSDSAAMVAELTAGERAASLGVAGYTVSIHGDQSPIVDIELRSRDGADVGRISAFRDNDGRHVKVVRDGRDVEIRMNPTRLSITEAGREVYSLDAATARATHSAQELASTVAPPPQDLTAIIALANAVVSDQGLRQHVASVTGGNVPYAVPDCPWWVSLASCLAAETGVGAVMCAACLASYLL